ncbi:hypothetical protein QBE52_08920 [Clostridiaceae bacterium 35-E11]
MRRRKKYKNFFRCIDKKIVGLILLAIGIAIIAVITLPYNVWIILTGCAMIYVGYKLFI